MIGLLYYGESMAKTKCLPYPKSINPKKSSLHLIQVREGNLVDVIAGLEDTLPAPN